MIRKRGEQDVAEVKLTARSQKKNETRQKLFEAACRLFSCSKFEEVKVEDITREAGYGKGTFFNYFDSKEDVVSEMQMSSIYDTLMPLLENDGEYVPRLKQALKQLLLSQSESKDLMRSIFLTKFKDERQMMKQAEMFESFYPGMTELVERAKAAGEIRSDIASREVVQMVEQVYMGVLVNWTCNLEGSPLEAHIGSSFDVLFDGLQPK
jgi:AcrR family transcriptional regulator